jgi:8-oxo-dGTP pyrophosphatase MutT (NUDIX family)
MDGEMTTAAAHIPGRHVAAIAVHVLLTDGERVLLLRRRGTGYEDGYFSVVAGHLDGGEDVMQAAVRETREEAGVTVDPGYARVVGVMHRRAGDLEWVNFFVEARMWDGEIRNAEPDKCAALDWFTLDALPDNTVPYVRRGIENYCEGRWFDSYGWSADETR